MEAIKEKTEKQRNVNMDFLRIFAVFSVISVHFFLNSGFYGIAISSKSSYFLVLIRTFFMICVPLFLILSGFLMNKKTLCKRYYRGIIKILVVYVFASIACLAFKILYLGQELSFWDCIKGIFDYSAAPYSWYVNMYIGLFLIIPFLNLIYNGLKTKKQKQILIFTFIFITSVPTISEAYVKLFPSWWGAVYPITYYFIGAYINEFGVKIKKRYNLVILLLCVVLFGTYNFFRSFGGKFEWGSYCTWNGFENLIDSVLVFIFINNLNFEKLGKRAKKVLAKVSNLTLGIYLVSYIFDSMFYKILNSHEPDIEKRILYYIIIVPAVFICSLILSYIIDFIKRIFS